MKIIRDIKNIKIKTPIIASIGGFDGVHLGHQKIIKNIVDESSKKNTKSAIITFNPLPKIFFSKKNFEILSIHKKIHILKKFNLDYLIILRFNKELVSMSSKDFIEEILINKLNIKSLTAGDDFKFGNNQSGTVNDLLEYSKKGYFSMNIENKHSIDNVRISSSQIREAIIGNDFEKAKKMLGRAYSVSGKIIHGEKRGREIGFPTANIKLKPNILLSGVYAVSTIIKGNKYNAVANIGYKPTFSGEQYLFEANIFNFSGDLYSERLEFNIISKIRETKKFSGISELKEYINKDVLEAKRILKEND
ncbi:riboflavin biosynthesis protein RibF [Gammaproteobacteria bacterium]|nr:riboflavin biosynthesis protein RibF [Gammaproteobacteria bacterium]